MRVFNPRKTPKTKNKWTKNKEDFDGERLKIIQ